VKRVLIVSLLFFISISISYCESGTPRPGSSSTSGNNIKKGTGGTDPGSIGPGGSTDLSPYGYKCGDGLLTEDEACDDKNTEDGDGCRGDCRAVEEGYSCNPPGRPCHLMSKCGNGIVMAPELCDDKNMNRGDGCNDLCIVEIGYKCEGSPSVCTKTTCGDGKIEGAEGCDDGNAIPFDGCNELCQVEPDCVNGGNCTSSCGDGLLIGEACDDGNNVDGDGCSSACTVENGYECKQPDIPGILEVPVIYKDFTSAHPDFEPGASGCEAVTRGMVKNRLGSDGKPVANSGTTQGCGTLNQLSDWYDHSSVGSEDIIITKLKLFDNGNGGFVNQWGESGEQWRAYINELWCADKSCGNCTCEDDEVCISPCTYGSNACCATPIYFDGAPFFFPLDGMGVTPKSAYSSACIGPTYGYESWPDEIEAVEIAGLTPAAGYSYTHNFHFTSEVRFWFQYDNNTTQILNFVGDDDVWVFINNQLVVDLGGIHTPQEGSVTINNLNLTHGAVYEIVVFQAERQTDGSTYRLTLSGFSTSRSECRPECGDGIVGVGEQCDDGTNDGGYGECAPGCVLGEYCGDNIIQEDYEDCDDGNFFDDDDCPSSCRHLVLV
jgi:fibro-slime domain-containing protein